MSIVRSIALVLAIWGIVSGGALAAPSPYEGLKSSYPELHSLTAGRFDGLK